MTRELDEQLTKYLTDAHSIEVQALAQLRTAPEIAGAPELADAFRSHLEETERHEQTIRTLLDARGSQPSRLKDSVMGLGGKGFMLFARVQPDTPGKLFAHALSYEALELASYELLERVSRLAGDGDVAAAAARIAADERGMIERLEALVGEAVEATLRERAGEEIGALLPKYLGDAHAIEEQAISLLERSPGVVDDARLEAVFSDHLAETREHAELVRERLRELGGDTSSLEDAALRLGALNWSAFFQAHPDTPGKLTAFAYAFEHLEIGGYEQLRRLAERADDARTTDLADRILVDERAAAGMLAAAFDTAAAAALRALGVTA